LNRTDQIIAKLESKSLPASVFFCVSESLDLEGKTRLEKYAKSGHFIANHTHRHKSLHDVGIRDFVTDIRLAHEALQDFSNFKSWFRFPFLKEGSTLSERDDIRSELAKMSYTQGYVTVDNFDWYMDKIFQDAVRSKKKVNFNNLRSAYVDMLVEGIEFYDNIALKTLGRSPKHVLLLHENDLAALYVGDLASHLRSKGWQIISVEDAYTDPIASMNPKTLRLNQGRVAALAIDQGYKGSIKSKWENELSIQREFNRRNVWR
jgi:peptidoglycan-N-acetylglucosamine deacetylase